MLSSSSANEALFLKLPHSVENLIDESNLNMTKLEVAGEIHSSVSKPVQLTANFHRTSMDYGNRSAHERTLHTNKLRTPEQTDGPKSRKRRRPRILSYESAYELSDQMSDQQAVVDQPFNTDIRKLYIDLQQMPSIDGGLSQLSYLLGSRSWGSRGRQQHRSLTSDIAPEVTTGMGAANIQLINTTSAGKVSGLQIKLPTFVSAPQSQEIGSTGMSIHLIDMSRAHIANINGTSPLLVLPPKKVLHDMDPDFMQAIGEPYLPISFKNLQRSATLEFSNSAGVDISVGKGVSGIAQLCQFSVLMSEAPMKSSVSNSDPKRTFLSNLIPNATDTARSENKKRDEDVTASHAAYASSVRLALHNLMTIIFITHTASFTFYIPQCTDLRTVRQCCMWRVLQYHSDISPPRGNITDKIQLF